MKGIRVFSLLLALALILSGCGTTISAANIDEAIASGGEYYHGNMSSWEETLAAVAAGAQVTKEDCEKLIVITDQAVPTARLAGYICLLSSIGADSRIFDGVNLVDMLVQRQSGGSFAFLYDSLLAALALESSGATYDLDGLLRYLISAQRADGSFEDDMSTGLALTLLSTIEDVRAQTMAARAVDYLSAKEIDDAALPLVAAGLSDMGIETKELLARVIAGQGEDGSFPTPLHLIALDSIKTGKSIWIKNVSSEVMVLVQILVDGRTVETGRIEADPTADVLSLTKRFCADRELEIITVQGKITQIGRYSGIWTLTEGSSTQSGGSIIWSN